MKRRSFCPLCFLVILLNEVNGNPLQYYSSFKFGDLVYGEEHLIKDFLTLDNDPKGNLPGIFTICSSVFVDFPLSQSSVFQILKDDGSPWFLLELAATNRDYKTLSEVMLIRFEDPVTGVTDYQMFVDTIIPIVPHSWYHICLGLDTGSGLLRIVVNSLLVVNEEKDYFKDTKSSVPTSLKGNLLIFKGYWSKVWYQYRSTFSNLNIFSSMMSVDDMVTRTAGEEGCDSPGDYLRYQCQLHVTIIYSVMVKNLVGRK